MVDGKFKCIGSVQHLKTKFGEGYTLTVKLKEMPKYISCASSNALYDDDTELESSTMSCSYVKSVLDSAARPSSNKYINQILKELKDKISINCRLKERHFNNVYQFELPCPNSNTAYEPNTTGASCVSLNADLNDFNIGDVYRLIELNKLKFNIADYSLSQNTLDNVFINFVKEQTNKKKQQQQLQKSGALDNDPQDYSSGDDSDNEHSGNSSRSSAHGTHKSRKEVHFPIQDTDDLLIDFDDNLIDLDSRQLSLSDNHADSTSEISKFEIANYSDSRSSKADRVS